MAWLNKSYQMNPANYREALTEMREDESEGADILLVGSLFLCVLGRNLCSLLPILFLQTRTNGFAGEAWSSLLGYYKAAQG